jgi:cyclohexyl-isocyanide hydratase
MIPASQPLQIGSLLFEDLDQIDLTGPFEVLSRLDHATTKFYGLSPAPVRDMKGLRLTPDAPLKEAPQLDVLHVPGGPGQEALMENQEVLSWVRTQAAGAKIVFSVCTGALICGAAGLLKGRRATTHWTARSLLPYFGATPVDARVVMDGPLVCAAGVTAGIDGALRVAAMLRGQAAAEAIQLYMQYAPEPPFDAGSPMSAPREIVAQAEGAAADLMARRTETAKKAAKRLGIAS